MDNQFMHSSKVCDRSVVSVTKVEDYDSVPYPDDVKSSRASDMFRLRSNHPQGEYHATDRCLLNLLQCSRLPISNAWDEGEGTTNTKPSTSQHAACTSRRRA